MTDQPAPVHGCTIDGRPAMPVLVDEYNQLVARAAGAQPEIDRLTAELADYDERAEQEKQRADEAERHLINIAQGGANADAVQAEIGEMIRQTHELREQLRRAEAELQQRAEAESADAAAGSYAGRAERVEARLTAAADLIADLIADHEGDEWAAHPATTALRGILDREEHAIADPARWLHIAFTSPDATTANTSALAIRDHLAAEFPGVGMRITSNAVEASSPPICELPHQTIAEEDECERERVADVSKTFPKGDSKAAEPGPRRWLLQGARDLSIPGHRRFTARPVTPEMERAATERAQQAAADSERSAAWFAATGGVIGAPAATEATGLRERLADALREHGMVHLGDQVPADEYDCCAEAVLATIADQLEIGEEQAWCKTCRRAWNSPAHRCESDAEQRVQQITELRGQWVAAGPPPLGVSTARWWDRRLVELGAVLDGPRPEPGAHVYLSTGCWHGDHDYCKSMTGLNGAKRPASCKKCAAKCVCPCHNEQPQEAP